jgi:hypothetical protein
MFMRRGCCTLACRCSILVPVCHVSFFVSSSYKVELMACSGVTLLLFLASINILLLRKWQGKRIHFPTLVFLFIIVIVDVTYFGIANRIHEVTLLESVHAEENDFSPGTPACTFRAVMSNVLSTLSILLNDVFFVSSSCVAQQVECTNRLTTDLPSVHTL